jgi:catechol-2,3-dioxygenase
MPYVRRFDHVGLTVADLDLVTAFFVALGLEEVNDLQAAVDWAATKGYGLVGGIGEYEGAWQMAYVRGPEGIIVSLAERLG